MKYNGEITVASVESDASMRSGTVQCVHCGAHWEHKPGSGRTRGWCGRCKGFVCGPRCAKCVPEERRLELAEAGLPWELHMEVADRLPVSEPVIWTPNG